MNLASIIVLAVVVAVFVAALVGWIRNMKKKQVPVLYEHPLSFQKVRRELEFSFDIVVVSLA